MRLIAIGICGLATCLAACGSGINLQSPGDIHSAIGKHPNHEGLYLIHYRHERMIDEYGPGIETVRSRIVESPENWRALWDEATAESVMHYMEEKGLTPDECDNGVVFNSSGSDEAGGGTMTFRCN